MQSLSYDDSRSTVWFAAFLASTAAGVFDLLFLAALCALALAARF